MGTPFTEIYPKFLKLINDPDFGLLTNEDAEYFMEQYLFDAIHLHFTPTPKELEIGDDKSFINVVPDRMQAILANAMLLVWVKPKIFKERLMRSAIADRDYSELSHANQLSVLEKLRENATIEIKQYVSDFWYEDESFEGFK